MMKEKINIQVLENKLENYLQVLIVDQHLV